MQSISTTHHEDHSNAHCVLDRGLRKSKGACWKRRVGGGDRTKSIFVLAALLALAFSETKVFLVSGFSPESSSAFLFPSKLNPRQAERGFLKTGSPSSVFIAQERRSLSSRKTPTVWQYLSPHDLIPVPSGKQAKQCFDYLLHPAATIVTELSEADLPSGTNTPATNTGTTFLGDPGMTMVAITTALRNVQRYGENFLGATLAVALIQGAVVLHQYRNNPRGGLVIPPGLTWGSELPPSEEDITQMLDPVKQLRIQRNNSTSTIVDRLRTVPGQDLMKRMQAVVHESMDEQQTHQNNDGEYQDYVDANKKEEETVITPLDKVKQAPDKLKKSWHRLNQYMIILLPWVTQQMSFVFARYGHLMHLGMIFGITSLLEFRSNKIPSLLGGAKDEDVTVEEVNGDTIHSVRTTNNGDTEQSLLLDPLTPYKILVIGDSLACGIGTIDRFDENKNKTNPLGLIENIGAENSTDKSLMKQLLTKEKADLSYTTAADPVHEIELSRDKKEKPSKSPHGLSVVDHRVADFWGPAFPRILAATLSQRMRRPVQWRSAGVDGGDVPQIREYCLDVVKEEVASGRAPDIVVILCGSNDLKTIVGNPTKAFTAEGGPAGNFRNNLVGLLQDILKESPNAKIVLPALPTHRLDQGSMLNVFPLTLFLDGFLGFWDSQKKKVADSSPANVIYCGLSTEHVSAWYQMPPDAYQDVSETADIFGATQYYGDEESISLISADGVHPNKRCYSLWANLVGNTVADKLMPPLQKDIPPTIKNGRSSLTSSPVRRKITNTERSAAYK
jgi:lysophospholipase L1-like esterase